MLFILGVLALFNSPSAWAYPEFIGYKYSSCVTCHYNGHGNGPINDYGRALWATEIAGRALALGRTPEELGEASGFLGRRELPWWFRPGLKGRGLTMRTSPGGDSTDRFIMMQAEGNVALFFDRDQRHIFVGSFGHAPIPNRLSGQPGEYEVDQWISREHYFRWQKNEVLWIYAGMMDKVYGIRTVNHTAYSRSRTGLAMNDQAHGIVAHWIQPKYEFTVNGFAGNLYQEADLRQMGLSSMWEYEYAEAKRSGFGNGAAVLAELGLIRNEPRTGKAQLGYYLYSEAIQKIARGYHAFVGLQMYKGRMEADQSDLFKTSVGALMFPMQRVEFRFELENAKQLNQSPSVRRDTWVALIQAHLSL
ncbi:MAG TPA: hypothetical protein PKC28_11030 [Bdellovibrionales bacterium]|nr:hypothetical protein [Bdellovibrionales bacterium]